MNRLVPLLFVLALPGPAIAQEQASTLLACTQRATTIVRATVLFASDPDPEWHRLQFRADEVLKGSVADEFVILEPSGACCGRSLFAMTPGDHCLLFLRATGALLHPFGGARGVLGDEPEVVAHVRALLAATTNGGDVAALLATSLAHPVPRIAADAAQALAVLPVLQLGLSHRELVGAALLAAVERGAVTAAPLVDVVARLGDEASLETLATTYLTTARTDRGALLRRGLLRCEPGVVMALLPAAAGDDQERQLRAAELLATLPIHRAGPALHTMLRQTTCPRVKLCATQALLEAGARPTDFVDEVPAPVLELAVRRSAAAREYRSIRPAKP